MRIFSPPPGGERNLAGMDLLNECLRKNMEFDIIERIAYNEAPPRVVYMVTSFGTKFIRILDELEKLQREIESEI